MTNCELLDKIIDLLDEIGDKSEEQIRKEADKFCEDEETSTKFIKLINHIKELSSDYSEQLRAYETLIANLPGFVYRCENNKNWTFSYAAGDILKLTGFSSEDYVSQKVNYGDLIVKEHQDMVWQEVQSAINDKRSYRMLYKIKAKDKSVKWVWEQGTGVFDHHNKLKFLEGFIYDVTDKVILQENIIKDEQQLKTLNDSIVLRELKMVELKKELEKMKFKN